MQTASSTPPSLVAEVSDPNHPIWQGFNIIGSFSGLPNTNIETAIAGFIRVFLSFMAFLLFINIFYSGILWMLSGGNEEKTSLAKKIIINSLIGLIIITFSYSIASFFIKTFVGATKETVGI
jgi:Zn-dependent protease with chaperone function